MGERGAGGQRMRGLEGTEAGGTGLGALGGGGYVWWGPGAIGQLLSDVGGCMQGGQVQLEVSLSACVAVPWLP